MLQESKIQSGFNIYDYANILLGGFDNIITLIQSNPKFESINVNTDLFATQKIVYDDQYYVSKTLQVQLPVTVQKSTLKSIRGLKGQNLYDLNLMAYSGFDNLVKFCQDNNINSTNDHDVSFKDFTFDTTLNTDITLQFVINKKRYVFATGAPYRAPNGNLLQENLFYLLQEDGFKLQY